MSNPENQTDQYLDSVMRDENAQVPLDIDAQLLNDLVELYQPQALSEERKQRMWDNAQLPKEKPKGRPSRMVWLGRLVATIVFIASIAVAYDMGHRTLYVEDGQLVYLSSFDGFEGDSLFDDPPEFFTYGGYVTVDNIGARAQMSQAGMGWVAHHVTFDPSNTTLVSETIDAIENAHNQEFNIFLSVDAMPSLDLSEDIGLYTEFLETLARAGADAIEIWSEANISRSMPAQYLGTDNYSQIIIEAADAIRRANPNTIIVSGAPAPTGAESVFPDQVINDDRFIRELQEQGVLDYVDCVGLHYMEGAVPPQATSGDLRDDYYTRYLPTLLDTYRDILGDKPLCVTELGYFSTEGLTDVQVYMEWANGTSQAEKQQWLSDAVEYLAQQDDVMFAMIWHIDLPTGYDGFQMRAGYTLSNIEP